MGVDYVQDRACQVKRELGVKVLVSRLKARGQAALLMKRLAADGQDPMTATITRVVQYPSGPVAEQITVEELVKTGQTLEPYRPLCENCTANFRQTDFGCCGFLNYPIARAEEEWLLARLPADLSSVAGVYLRSVLKELKIDGAYVARIRSSGGLYFEGGDTPLRRWSDGAEEVVVTADQLIEFLFYSGVISPSHGAFVCLFLGLLPHDIAPEIMRRILKKPATLQEHLTFDPAALSMLHETQMGMFLMGVMNAAINLEAMTIDA